MMKLSKLLGVAVLALATLGKVYSSEIDINFMNGFYCAVDCNKQGKSFNDVNKLSAAINGITGEYLKTTSVQIDTGEFNTVNFNGIQIIKPCSVSIKGSPEFKPRVVFNFAGNEHLSKLSVGDNISKLIVKSNNNIVNINVLENSSDAVVEIYGDLQIQNIIDNPRSRIVPHGVSLIFN